jgi:hypothetical protein
LVSALVLVNASQHSENDLLLLVFLLRLSIWLSLVAVAAATHSLVLSTAAAVVLAVIAHR